MENNIKSTITLESLRNKKLIKICYYIIGLFLIFFIVSMIWAWDKTGIALLKETDGLIFLTSSVFVLLVSISLCFRTIKKTKLKEGYIDKSYESFLFGRYLRDSENESLSHHINISADNESNDEFL